MPTVLIVAASPLDQDRLRLNFEVKEIKNALQRSKNREDWCIESNEATTVDDLRRALLDVRPTVVHFAGHGGNAGLCFEDAAGNSHQPDCEPLAKLLHNFREHLKCVVLNACYSESQGNLIRNEIDFVVGMRAPIADETATKFAVAFYDAVFAGTDFRTAFDLGCTALDLSNDSDAHVPLFLTNSQIEQTTLVYSAKIPAIETFLHAYVNTPFSGRAPLTTTGGALVPLMRRHYGELLLEPIRKVRVITAAPIEGDVWRVVVECTNTGGKRIRTEFHLRIKERDIRVEWEASVGLWSVPITTYLAIGSREPVVARVTAELSGSYFGVFRRERESWQSIDLRPSERVPTLQGYVEKNTDLHAELMQILTDGRKHSLTIGIAPSFDYDDNEQDPSNSIILELYSKNWLYQPESSASKIASTSTPLR